ncbi:sigma-54-dependent transcriptional regulator [Reichenbachiella versicolor]|uniref:sigma-54-dependent transcriptional regulator n=1 Tax=Reichenbachiella versicolor TaxID=1821036 RepID=UPI000D6E6D80|nr:sigma-54 dependent transcriptional regulator [Reichenbachiella versicolor]
MILIIDDDRAVQSAFRLLLDIEGFETRTAHHPNEGMEIIQQDQPELILLDLNYTDRTSGEEGLAFLGKLKSNFAHIPVILVTGWGSIPLAVEGMKLGAADFINKPWDDGHLMNSIRTALELSKKTKLPSARVQLDEQFDFSMIIGESPQIVQTLNMISRVSQTDAPVLVLGPSGTGKELAAEAIHRNSLRKDKPFVKVNLGGISTSLFESEMFGHKKGAFTDAYANRVGRFEMAEGGTIFLDEIGDLDLASQVKLLRVLQDKTYQVLGDSRTKNADVRVVAATNKNLPEMIKNGQFREDLFYRINLVSLELPALSQRKSDIPHLVRFFIKQLNSAYKRKTTISDSAIAWLSSQFFEGNIRELKNQLERTFLLSMNDELQVGDFQILSSDSHQATGQLPENMTIDQVEEMMIKNAIETHQHNLSKVADALGLSRGALYRRLEKYGIKTQEQK